MSEEKKLLCEVCDKNEIVGVCSVPGVPYSARYCRECLQANSHPMGILVANTACIGGYDESAEWWREMVNDSLKAQGKTLEWFKAEVEKAKAEIDAAEALDDFIKESGA